MYLLRQPRRRETTIGASSSALGSTALLRASPARCAISMPPRSSADSDARQFCHEICASPREIRPPTLQALLVVAVAHAATAHRNQSTGRRSARPERRHLRVCTSAACSTAGSAVSDKHSTCETCGARLQDCPGHYGHIQLVLPVFHLGYFKPLIATLQCICKTCSRVLMPRPSERAETMRQMATRSSPTTTCAARRRQARRRACKKVRECPHCGALNGLVKKVGSMRIMHEKYKEKDKTERAEAARREFHASFEASCAASQGHLRAPQTSGADLKPLCRRRRTT